LSYGFKWSGLQVGTPPLCELTISEPDIEVRQMVTSPGVPSPVPEVQGQGDQLAAFPLVTGGWLVLDRREGSATFHVPVQIDPQELIHPYLVPAAAGFCEWVGWEAYHAGAFAAAGRAWAVVGDKEGGKSTLLAALAQRGLPVLSDDLLVLDDRRVLHGPRLIDLREPAAAHLGLGKSVSSAREGGRWRMHLGPTPDVDLAGWVFLRWGEEVDLRPVSPAARIERLLGLLPTRAEAVVSLASLPAYELVRPRSWDALPEALDRLLDRLGERVAKG
jgi:hypothetical protein